MAGNKSCIGRRGLGYWKKKIGVLEGNGRIMERRSERYYQEFREELREDNVVVSAI